MRTITLRSLEYNRLSIDFNYQLGLTIVLGITILSITQNLGLSILYSFSFSQKIRVSTAILKRFFEHSLQFVFYTQSKVPYILKLDSKSKFFGGNYRFVLGKDEIIVDGTAGYIVSFGDMLHRLYDAVI